MPKWMFILGRAADQLWLRVAAYSAVGVVTALIAVLLAPFIPQDFALKIGTGAVDQVLGILATSMLTVATFSLATLVTAYTAVSAAASPRAVALLVSDGRGQGALATFVGAFVYAVVGIFALQTGYYGAQGRVIIFFVTVVVLGAVVLALLRWIEQLAKLGRVGEAINRVAEATRDGLQARLSRRAPPQRDRAPEESLPVRTEEVGYVRNIDVDRMERRARDLGVTVYIEALPGAFVHAAQPLGRCTGRANLDTEALDSLRDCWTLGEQRSFEQDPRLGFTVLGEIGAKALSPGINDPGTAMEVIVVAVRLLSAWVRETPPSDSASAAPHLRFAALSSADLLDDVFSPIARYGSGDPLVAARLQTALRALHGLGDPEMSEAVQAAAAEALDRAERGLELESDRERVRRASAADSRLS